MSEPETPSAPAAAAPRAKPGHFARLLLPALLLASLAGSLWAILGEDGCASCGGAEQLLGGLKLAPAGVVAYTILFLLSLAVPRSFLFTTGILAAASVHLALLSILAANRILCPPCLLTAAGALLAAGVVLRRDPEAIRRAAVVMAATLILANGGIAAVKRSAAESELKEARKAARDALEDYEGLPDDLAQIVTFYLEDCPKCRRLDREILPAVEREFAGKLSARELRDPWKGLPVPTVVVIGRQSTLFAGTPSEEDLRRAVRLALNGPGSGPAPEKGEPVSPD